MSLHVGIVGLPNVGKSTLFKAITKKQVECSIYPFCTIDPNIGVVNVVDLRVDKLAELTKSAKKIYTTVEFVDIAGLVKGAAHGEGLGNQFLAQIRETDAIVYILRAFKNDKVISYEKETDVLKEKEILDVELSLKDLETVEKRIKGLEGEVRAAKKEAIDEMKALVKTKEFLQTGKILAEQGFNDEERKILSSYQLLTMKPRLYVINGSDSNVSKETIEVFQKNNWPYLVVDIQMELDAQGLTPDERVSFGLPAESKLDDLIKKSYELLNLITFFTILSNETRAWTVKQGSTAPTAGGVIHTDFEKKFIRAEVINWQDLLNAGGFVRAREKGLIRTEGKEYVVRDGDVIEIKSNP
jgi:GTP-binding protein YchF